MDKLKKAGIGFFVLFVMLLIPVSVSAQTSEIPAWVKGVANFWAEDNISDDEFGKAIAFLIEQEIIKVKMPQQNDEVELEKMVSQLESENMELQREINNLKNVGSKFQTDVSGDITCDEFYFDVMHWSIVDAFYGRLGETAKSQGVLYDDEDLLKTSDELFRIAAHNGLSDDDLERYRSTCLDQLSTEQNLAVNYLMDWISKFGL